MTVMEDLVSSNVPHLVTQACWGTHCFVHDVDEVPADDDYMRCGECFHIFRTEPDLLVADRMRGPDPDAGFRDPKLIHACPLCAHVF